MRIVVQKQDVILIGSLSKIASRMTPQMLRDKGMRAVIDAGKKTKTRVQRAVTQQMNLQKGFYGRYVVANTRGYPYRGRLSYEIFGVRGGQTLEYYKGTRVLSRTGQAAGAGNAGRSAQDAGQIRSAVWNNARIFKRSFEMGGALLTTLPGGSKRAPKRLWTYGHKPTQSRQSNGRFGVSTLGITYGKLRTLYGPSLMKEIPKGQSLATFQAVAPLFLEEAAMRQIAPLMKL